MISFNVGRLTRRGQTDIQSKTPTIFLNKGLSLHRLYVIPSSPTSGLAPHPITAPPRTQNTNKTYQRKTLWILFLKKRHVFHKYYLYLYLYIYIHILFLLIFCMLMLVRQKITNDFFLFEAEQKAKMRKRKKDKKRIFKKLRMRKSILARLIVTPLLWMRKSIEYSVRILLHVYD